MIGHNICLDGSNDRSQHMFLWRNMANYPQIILVTPSYPEHCDPYVAYNLIMACNIV